jgi:heparin binding hemagglutinin HbhA
MAVTFPSKFDVREARDSAQKLASEAWDPFREPTLAVLGLGDIALATARDAASRVQSGVSEAQNRIEELPTELQELRGKLTAEEFRRLVDSYLAAVRSVYADLVKRGTSAYSQILSQPQVKQVIARADAVSTEVESRLEDAVEGVRVRGESTMAGVSKQTRSVGERAARATQRFSAKAAEEVAEAGSELSEDIKQAGAEAASETRSATRKAANQAAPRKQGPKNAPASGATKPGAQRAKNATS